VFDLSLLDRNPTGTTITHLTTTVDLQPCFADTLQQCLIPWDIDDLNLSSFSLTLSAGTYDLCCEWIAGIVR